MTKSPRDQIIMMYTQGTVAQMEDTVKHREHSHSGTVTVEKQQQQLSPLEAIQ